jgi:phosphatidylglycerol:prolipoprotein diacylglycerol transferase
MLIHPQIDPVALQLGPLAIHWYGLTYLAAFGLFYWLGTRRLGHLPFAHLPQWQKRDVEDILFLGVLGVVLGGRVGYCLFYKPAYYLSNPLEILAVWQGGMSFHGGLLGVMLAMVWFARTRQPDAHLGLLSLGMSMGQWLCVPMMLGGLVLWGWGARQANRS